MAHTRLARYEATWSSYEDCGDVVHRFWYGSSDSQVSFSSLMQKLKRGMSTLQRWSKGKAPLSDSYLQAKLQWLYFLQQSMPAASIGEIHQLQREINGLLESINVKWQQRAKEHWLQKGDRNSRYFHSCATQRKKRNCIVKITDERGIVYTKSEEIAKVSEDMNAKLTQQFTAVEVEKALFQMGPYKALGLDGYGACFFQHHWSTMKGAVCQALLSFLNDNTLAAYETLHTMNFKMYGKKGYMALKLDMSKTYDHVEWGFLHAVIQQLGFASRWTQLIMNCVSTSSFSILVNGSPQQLFSPSRGLRQGCPLSPYLFILCAETLSSQLLAVERQGLISGVPIIRGELTMNHLFFADDSLMFFQANMVEWGRLNNILSIYEQASGQQLNREKTSLFLVETPNLLPGPISKRLLVYMPPQTWKNT
ncbi:uncharacterized protein LOC122304606 [Carya illinoinensis]|uniref:uncharacterized protein LOC122304606 n=1 Tax=Carya illinoinensis TaxID=32201 RepID=UPI001C729C7C|nr:uncharacterized protein LOC122304606 [Carya illinoinensis]